MFESDLIRGKDKIINETKEKLRERGDQLGEMRRKYNHVQSENDLLK